MELKTITRVYQHATRGHGRPGAAASTAIIANATPNTIKGIIIVRPTSGSILPYVTEREGAPVMCLMLQGRLWR
jgi:hypothetical protein